MAFSSAPGSNGRVSPPGRGGLRQAANGGGMISARDSKVSRIGFLSIVLIVYSGLTLGLIMWNQSSGRGSEPPSAETAWQDDSRQKLPPPRTGGGVEDFSNRNEEVDGRRPGGLRGPKNSGADGGESDNRGSVGERPPSGFVINDGARDESRGGEGGLHTGEDGKEGGLVLHGQPANEDAMAGGDYGRRPGRSTKREGGDLLATSPPMEGPFDVTLVSQTSQNRFWMLPFLCKRWPGPISIAILEEDRNALPEELCNRMIISSTKAQSPDELDPVWYPVNRLRNVAVRAVATSHFLMTDIDIWPDVNAYQALHMRYRLETERLQDARNAIVFSAFSRRRFCEVDDCLDYANDVPETIADLKPCLETNTCGRFDAANQSGQGTAYVYYWRSMLRQPNQRSLEHIVCFKSHRFEPYLVVRKSTILPMFDERFSGYGKNKIQWINHLRYSGFSFYVMPVNFVIHAPHPKSVAKTVWEKTGGGKQGKGNKIMDQTFDTFMAELRAEKGDNPMVTELCQPKERSSAKKRSVHQFAHDVPDGARARRRTG